MEVCRTCLEDYDGYGDGWDGECPDCADQTYNLEFCKECGEEKDEFGPGLCPECKEKQDATSVPQ